MQVSLLTENGGTKDDLRLPTDEALLTQVAQSQFVVWQSFKQLHSLNSFSFFYAQIKAGFDEGKDLIVSVQSAMGEEQICGLKDIGGKNQSCVATVGYLCGRLFGRWCGR